MLKLEEGKEKPVKCLCGKLIAIERDGRIYVYCKRCKREVEVCRTDKPQSRES